MTSVPLTARLRGWAIVLVWGLSLLAFGPLVIVLSVLTRNPRAITIPTRWICRLGFKVGGMDVVVEGLEKLRPDQPYVFVANHTSWLDATAMFAYLGRDVAFLAKKELYRIPILNPGLYCIDCAPIDRRNRERAIASIRGAAERLRRGRSFIVYPEGTRSPDGRMRPFKRGAFHMAIEAGAPVVPITIDGSHEAMPKGPVRAFPGVIHLTVHDPIEAAEYTPETVDQLAKRAWNDVHAAMRRK